VQPSDVVDENELSEIMGRKIRCWERVTDRAAVITRYEPGRLGEVE
jgi:hypothetical protein